MRRRTGLTGVIGVGVALICSTVSGQAQSEFKTPTAITGIKAVTEPGSTLDSVTILIVDGRIRAVGEAVEIPSYAERIDGTDLIAYPGFIDAETFLGIPDESRSTEERERTEDLNPDPRQGPLPATRFANRRGIRPQFRAAELYAPDEKQLKDHRAAGFTVALIVPRDGILSGTSGLLALSGAPIRRSVLAGDVAMHGSFRTGEDGDYPQTLLGIIAQFRQVMLDAGWYSKMRLYAQRHPASAPRAPTDPALDALQPLLGRAKRLVFEANSENEIRRALDLAAEFNLDVAISGARQAWKVLDRIKAERVPLIVSLKFDEEPAYGKKKETKKSGRKGKQKKPDAAGTEADVTKESDDSSGTTGASVDGTVEKARREGQADKGDQKEEEKGKAKKGKKDAKKIYEPLKVRKERRRLWEEQVANLIRLHEAGVPFSLRTSDLKSTKEFWKNLRLVIERGLPEEAAIAALTTTPAAFAGLSDQLGGISRGRIANLTIMSKPLGDKKSKVRYVFIDGEKFEMEEGKKKGDGKKEGEAEGKKPDAKLAEREGGGEKESETEKAESATTVAAEPVSGEAKEEQQEKEEDTGPTFETEIKADRIPKTHTGGNVLIRNATIIPVSSPTLDHASILIRNGKIEAIGQIPDVPDDVTVIDGQGRFVIPGFVDCHSHLGIDGVNESALAISAEVRIGDLINPQSVGIFRAAAGGTTTHHVMHGSANPIGGQNAIVKTKYGRSAREMLVAGAPRTIKFALGENVTQANWQPRWGKRFPNTRMGVEAVIRAGLEAGKAYRAKWDEYERRSRDGEDVPPPRRDLRLEALADVVSGDLTVHSHCYRSDEILRLLATAEDYGFRIGTLQHVLEGYRIAPEIARHGCGASTFSNFWAYKMEAYGAIAYNAALMTEHGINVSINSDSPNTIRYFGQEAAKCIRWGGLSENQALRLVTLNPAMQLQIDDRVGSLEVGKDGDLAIFNGHPLNTFSKCIMTIIEGEVYFEDDRPEPVAPADTVHIVREVDRTIPKTPHQAYAITGATIHPISGPKIENGTVVIVEDRIQAVGTDVVIPPGAGVIDGTGLHVYPGMIDAGGNLGLTEIGSIRATRDSSDIAGLAPQLRAASAIHPHSVHFRIARTGGITTALTEPSGGQISGQSAVIHLEGWTAPEMLIVKEYALHMSVPSLPPPSASRRFRFPPAMREQREKETKKALRELEAFIEKAKRYAEAKKAAAEDPSIRFDVDLALEAMVPYVRGEKPVVFAARGYKQILDTIEFAKKHGLKCILNGATDAWKLADKLAEEDIPVILASPLSYPRGQFEPWDAIYRCAGVLDRAGVRFCFASGSASGASNLGTQVGMAVAHGLPVERAEYAVTLGAAKILGIADRTGSIEVGKKADLIVTTGSPLQTVSLVTHMFIDGKPVELTSLHTEEYEKFKNRPEPHLPPLPELRGPKSLTVQ